MVNNALIFTLDSRDELVNSIIKATNNWNTDTKLILGQLKIKRFSDLSWDISYIDSVRGKSIYIFSPTRDSDEIMKLFLAVDAAKRAGAKEIVPIVLYYPYARSDKKDNTRGPIGAKMIALMLESLGITSLISFDMHAGQIQGFFEVPVTEITGDYVFASYLADIIDDNMIFASPDSGGAKRVKHFKSHILKYYGMDIEIVMIDKTRKTANEVDKMVLIGNVDGKDVVLIDDMSDTGNTLCMAADLLIQKGAKSVKAIISHPVFSALAYEKINKSKLDEVIVSDSLPINPNVNSLKITVISIADQLGMAICANINNMSYEALKDTK